MQRQGSIEFIAEAAARTGAERKVYRMTLEGKALLAGIKNVVILFSKCLALNIPK